MRYRYLVLASCLVTFVTPSYAQLREEAPPPAAPVIQEFELKMWQRGQEKTDQSYREVLGRIKKENDRIYNNTRALRSFYPRTSQYTAFSDKLIDNMTRYAYVMDTAEDQLEKNRAFVAYHDLLNNHLPNLDVVSFALNMSRLNANYGNDFFLEKVRAAVIKDLMNSGNGKDPDNAYKVVTHSEEAYVLAQKGGEVEKSEMYPVNRKFYNVHDIVHEDGSFEQVYIDVTMPIQSMQMKQAIAERGKALDLPPQ